MSRRKEIAKFFCGVEAVHAFGHGVLLALGYDGHGDRDPGRSGLAYPGRHCECGCLHHPGRVRVGTGLKLDCGSWLCVPISSPGCGEIGAFWLSRGPKRGAAAKFLSFLRLTNTLLHDIVY